MRFQSSPAIFLLFPILFLSSCNLPTAEQTTEVEKPEVAQSLDTSEILATVNGLPITDQQFEVFVQTINKNAQTDSLTAEQKKKIVAEMADRILLQQYAIKWGLDKEVRIEIALNLQRQLLLALAAKKNMLENDIKISDAQLKARYESEKEKAYPTEYHIQHINVATEEDAKNIIIKLYKESDFNELAKEFSLDKSKDNGGDLGWVQKANILPVVFNNIEKMEKGKFTTAPVQTQSGWQIVKLVDSRPVTFLEYDQAKSRLLPVMQREQLSNKILALREAATIEIKE